MLLDEIECQANDVAPQHAPAYQEHREPEKQMADGGIVGAQRLQYANHLCTLNDDDE